MRYSPASFYQLDTACFQTFIAIPKQGSVFSQKGSSSWLNFDAVSASDETVYPVGYDIRLVNLGPIALFNEFILTTSNGKSLESIDHPHVLSLAYELLNSSFAQND